MLKNIIKNGEGETVEFKLTISSQLKIAKTLVSFANTRGGKIFVGIKDNGKPLGTNIEEEKYMLEGASLGYCKPAIPLLFSVEKIEGKSILVATVEESSIKPHLAKGEDGKWWAYIRVKDQCLLASKVMLDVLRSESREEQIKITYGWAEKKLLEYLQSHPRITLKEYCKMANISRWRANKILVNLVRMKIIKVLSHEKNDFYCI